MKKNKGITLIALIITIIVMLILVAVTIDVAIDGKLFDTAKDAVDKTNDKVGEQQDRVDELMGELDDVIASSEAIPGIRVDEDLPYTVEGQTVTIPKGFAVSGIQQEQTISQGLVIYEIPEGITPDWTKDDNGNGYLDVQEDYNQYVWVPTEGKETALISWNGENVAYSVTEDNATDTYYQAQQNINILGKADDNIKQVSNENNGRINRAKDDATGLVDIDTNGFWVGRYETSYNSTTSKMETKKNKVPYTNVTVESLLTYTGTSQIPDVDVSLESYNNEAGSNIKVERTAIIVNNNFNAISPYIISGLGWDLMISWINETNGTSYYTKGHIGSGTINTGTNENYKANNIYDLSGNVSEYVVEYYGTTSENVYRGANYSMTSPAANIRNHNDGSASNVIGTRLVLMRRKSLIQ